MAIGQRLAYIVMRAELEGVVCSGAMRGKQHTYALLDERAPNARPLPREEALAELTKRYFTSHGPALVQDFAWWSGLTVADAKAGIEMSKAHLKGDSLGDKTYWSAPSATAARLPDPTIHLLPNYDEYLIAYRDHTASLDARTRTGSPDLYDVLSRHMIVLNGEVIGGWRNVLNKNEVDVETRLLAPLSEAQRVALAAAAQRYDRFVGLPVTVRPESNER